MSNRGDTYLPLALADADMSARRRTLSSQVLLGALIVLVGLLLLGRTTGLYDFGSVFRYLPSLFVVLGLYAMVRSGFRNLFGPLVIVVLAGAWQLVALNVVESSDVVQLWPLFLVLFGLSIILSQWRRPPDAVGESHVSTLAVFSGSEKRSSAKSFTGANLTALFGGAELDLRDAEVADPPAHVSAIAMFGGVEVIVPREWRVEMDVLPILGGASDERPRRAEEHDEVDLVVSGFAAFGGVEGTD